MICNFGADCHTFHLVTALSYFMQGAGLVRCNRTENKTFKPFQGKRKRPQSSECTLKHYIVPTLYININDIKMSIEKR